MTPLQELAEFVYKLSINDLPSNVISAAQFCVLDTIGSALGATSSQEISSISNEYLQWCAAGNNGLTANIWGQGISGSVHHALMINGCLSHDLELDDVHTASKSHIGAVVVPTAWTIADAIGASGERFLEAVIAGYEVMGRVGSTMDVSSNRKRGWHTTGIIGTFGAAAAASKLLNLNPTQITNALGMAGTQSSGLWAFLAEGSTCKKLHCARASINGLDSALLAKSGMTGAIHILDAKDGGLYQAICDSFDMSKLCDKLGENYAVLDIDKKPYPCCRTTHHAIDAALKLRDNISDKHISSILVETYDVGVLQCGFEKYPESTVEAKFSIAFCVAVAFVYGKVSQEEFSTEAIVNPEIIRIAKSTKVIAEDMFTSRYPKRWGSRMIVTDINDQQYICQIDDMSGSVASPLTAKQEIDKFMGLVSSYIGNEKTHSIINQILNIKTSEKMPYLF